MDESSLTGESLAVTRRPGDQVTWRAGERAGGVAGRVGVCGDANSQATRCTGRTGRFVGGWWGHNLSWQLMPAQLPSHPIQPFAPYPISTHIHPTLTQPRATGAGGRGGGQRRTGSHRHRHWGQHVFRKDDGTAGSPRGARPPENGVAVVHEGGGGGCLALLSGEATWRWCGGGAWG